MQIDKKKTIDVLCVLFLLCGIELFAAEPVWIATPYKSYPSSHYLTGLGDGQTAEQAEISAIESLASVFGQDIQSLSTATKRMVQTRGEGASIVDSTIGFSAEIQRTVSIENLIGVRIAEHYSDGKRHFALAVMDRQEAGEILVSVIENNNVRIESLLECGDDEYSLSTYARLDFAGEISSLNDSLLKRLDIVDADRASYIRPNCTNVVSIKKRKAEISRHIPIYIDIQGDSSGNQVRQSLAKMISSIGLKTSNQAVERYALTGSVVLSKREPADGKSIQCVYTFEGCLKDTLVEEILMPICIQGREGARNMNDAVRRAYRSIDSKIHTTVASEFSDFLGSL